MKFRNKRIWAAYCRLREPDDPVDYMDVFYALGDTLDRKQAALLNELADRFGELVQFERAWYFQKGWLAAEKDRKTEQDKKKETPD